MLSAIVHVDNANHIIVGYKGPDCERVRSAVISGFPPTGRLMCAAARTLRLIHISQKISGRRCLLRRLVELASVRTVRRERLVMSQSAGVKIHRRQTKFRIGARSR